MSRCTTDRNSDCVSRAKQGKGELTLAAGGSGGLAGGDGGRATEGAQNIIQALMATGEGFFKGRLNNQQESKECCLMMTERGMKEKTAEEVYKENKRKYTWEGMQEEEKKEGGRKGEGRQGVLKATWPFA